MFQKLIILFYLFSSNAVAGWEGSAGSRVGLDYEKSSSNGMGFFWFILVIGGIYFVIIKYDNYSQNRARKVKELKRIEMVNKTTYEERLNEAAGMISHVGNIFLVALEYEVNVFEMISKAFPGFSVDEIQEVIANDYHSSAIQKLKDKGLM